MILGLARKLTHKLMLVKLSKETNRMEAFLTAYEVFSMAVKILKAIKLKYLIQIEHFSANVENQEDRMHVKERFNGLRIRTVSQKLIMKKTSNFTMA